MCSSLFKPPLKRLTTHRNPLSAAFPTVSIHLKSTLWNAISLRCATLRRYAATPLRYATPALPKQLCTIKTNKTYITHIQYKDRFEENSDTYNFPAFFVWGLESTDNGNYWDPENFGEADYVSVDFTGKESQQWMRDWCNNALASDWYEKSYGDECWIDTIITYMEDDCSGHATTACCGYNATRDFPFEKDEFKKVRRIN